MVYLCTVMRVIPHWQPPVLRRLANFRAAAVGDARTLSNPAKENERASGLHTDSAIRRKRLSQRGGQNLSARYQRLQTSLRGKEARTKEVELLEKVMEESRENATTALGLLPSKVQEPQAGFAVGDLTITAPLTVEANSTRKAVEGVQLFKGLAIPRKPEPPADDECCMSGCAICVYDLYEESLQAYDTSVAQVRKALVAMGVQEGEWPKSILPTGQVTQPTVQSTARDAFEEMERALQKKKEAREAIASHTQSTVLSSINAAPNASQGSSMPAMASLSS